MKSSALLTTEWYARSLNILSHRNTTELMTRWSGVTTAAELMKLFHVAKTAEDDAVKTMLKEKTFGPCPICGEGKVIVKPGARGLFRTCNRFPKCHYSGNITEMDIVDIYGESYMTCEHGHPMKIRYSPRISHDF